MANWPGTPLKQEEYGRERLLEIDPAAAPAAQQPQTPSEQWPGQGVDGYPSQQPQGPAGAGELEGDLGFYNDSAMDANSRPPRSDEYQRAMMAGLNDGSIRSPDDANQLAAKFGFHIPDQAALKRAFEQGPITGVNPAEYATKPVAELRHNAVLPEQADAFARGVPGAFGLDDEIDAIVTTAAAGDWGELPRNLANSRAIRDYDEENNFWPRFGGEVAGGLATGMGVPSRVREAASVAARQAIRMGGTRAQALAAARRAIALRSAQEGGGFGAVAGFGEADGNLMDRTLGAFGGGAAGAVAGGAVGGLGAQIGRLTQRGARPDLTEAQQVGQAADRLSDWLPEGQNFDLLPADVGGAMTRRLTGAAAQGPLSAQPIVAAAGRVSDNSRAVRDAVAESVGMALRPEAAGQAARSGATKFIQSSGAQVSGLYRAAERAAGDARISPKGAIEALDKNIAELAETPGGAPALEYLTALRDELAKGDVSVGGLLRMRTVMRDRFVKDGLTGSDTERRVGQVLDAAQEDVSEGLLDEGLEEAAGLYRQAANAHRERITTIHNVLKPIIGTREQPRSGEQIVKTLMADLQGNNARAVKFLRSLPAEEQANTRASIIGSLGRASKGQQNADGDAFSLPTFLTHWNEIGETAKRAFFGDEARAALNDLAKVAQGTKAAQRYQNSSNTAGGIIGQVMLSGGVGAAGGLPGLAAASLAQYGGGRLLASARFARWLARAPRTQLSPPAYIDRLSRIARAEPAIAGDILNLQRRLTEAFSPTRIAADEAPSHRDGIIGENNEGAEQRRQPEPTP